MSNVPSVHARIYHPNTKIIFCFVCIFAFLAGLKNVCIYVIEIGRLTISFHDPCHRLWWTPLLFYLRYTNMVFQNGMNCSLVVLCVERIICICKLKSYEESARPALVVIFLAALTLAFSVTFFLLLSPGVEWSKSVAVATIRNSNNTRNYQIMIVFVTVTELIGMFAFLFIHFWCLQRRKSIRSFVSTQTLSVKFQIEETLNLTNLILPVVLVKGGMQLYSNLAAYLATMLWTNPPIDTQMIIFEVVAVVTIQSFTTSLLLLHGTGQLKRFFCCDSVPPNRVSTTSITANDVQEEHFRRLKQLFEQELDLRKL
ncbi:serpentine type 7TM GPCR receptor class ab chemoreceptor domain-containing protein [Ditylenchus destructor]|nr:serpentine type 7TM GPCR receptor class ab chemoreceptor domain-containing protein [Ditylenchus destructor]